MELDRVIANLICPKEGNAENASLSPINDEEVEGAEMDQEGLEDEGVDEPAETRKPRIATRPNAPTKQ